MSAGRGQGELKIFFGAEISHQAKNAQTQMLKRVQSALPRSPTGLIFIISAIN